MEGRGARRGQGVFPVRVPELADGGFGGLEWAGGARVGRRAEKPLWSSSARRPEELPVQDEVRESRPRRLPRAPEGLQAGTTWHQHRRRPTLRPFLPGGAPGLSEPHSGPFFRRALTPGLLRLPAPGSPPESLGPVDRAAPRSLRGPRKPRVLLPTGSPPPRSPQVTCRHLRPVPLAPDRRRDWGGAGRRAGARPGLGRGGTRWRGGPITRSSGAVKAELALTLTFPERVMSPGKQPILAGTAPLRPRPATQQGTRRHHPGVEDPAPHAPLPGAGRRLSAGCGAARQRRGGAALGSTGGWGWGGVSAIMGTPARAGKGAGSPVGSARPL